MSKNQHVYALFERLDDALMALSDIQSIGLGKEHFSAILHKKHVDTEDLVADEHATTEGAAGGATIGGTVGVVLGGLAALGGGLVGIGPLAAAALAGGIMAAYGAMAGGILGSDEAKPSLQDLEAAVENGMILIAIQTDDDDVRVQCEAVFTNRGGRRIQL